jgi:Na+-transporting methylmalonyl-CoA/oxaloacetate decarboxylase beta subunit
MLHKTRFIYLTYHLILPVLKKLRFHIAIVVICPQSSCLGNLVPKAKLLRRLGLKRRLGQEANGVLLLLLYIITGVDTSCKDEFDLFSTHSLMRSFDLQLYTFSLCTRRPFGC